MSESAVETTGESGATDAQVQDTSTEDQQAEEQLFQVMQEQDPEELQKQVKHFRELAQRHQKSAQQNSAAAKRLKDLEDANRSDLEKAVAAQRVAEQERDALREQHTRMTAVAANSLDPELTDFLGTGTDEEITYRASQLSEIITRAATKLAEQMLQQNGGRGPGGPGQRRPVPSLTPGAQPTSQVATSANDMFRQLLHGESQ
jgi:hypothetical protein